MPEPADRARRAADALARARADARERGEGVPAPVEQAGPAGSAGSPRTAPSPGSGGPEGHPGGQETSRARQRRPRRSRREDPAPLRAAISGLLDDQGWRADAAAGSLFGRWDQIVGPELAAHTRPERLRGGELVVTADSTAWATQLRLLARTLAQRVNNELGTQTVRNLRVYGPAPPTQPGRWRVRGGRGPRDDYG